MITWNVSEQEADYILKVIQQRPFAEVHQLIQKLLDQANAPKQSDMFPVDTTTLQRSE